MTQDVTPTADEAANPPGGADVMLRVSHYALLSGLCQFIPIPFADDYADQQVRRQMVGTILERRGRSYKASQVSPLYEGPPKFTVGRIGSLAKGLILKPVKKLLRTVFFVATIRRALLEAAEVLLLGHTLDRKLAEGWLAEDQEPRRRKEGAAAIERAVADVMASPERRGIVNLIKVSARLLRNIRGEPDAVDPPEVAVTLKEDEDVEQALSPKQRERLRTATNDLQNRLQTKEGKSTLARLDTMIDARLAPTAAVDAV